jgi:hypothetical protein
VDGEVIALEDFESLRHGRGGVVPPVGLAFVVAVPLVPRAAAGVPRDRLGRVRRRDRRRLPKAVKRHRVLGVLQLPHVPPLAARVAPVHVLERRRRHDGGARSRSTFERNVGDVGVPCAEGFSHR